MRLLRNPLVVLGLGFLTALSSRAQTNRNETLRLVAAPMSFEAASVRPSPTRDASTSLFPLGPGAAYAVTGGRFRATGVTALGYIAFAYRMSAAEEATIEATAPDWVPGEEFDITAKAETDNPSKMDMRNMMQTLLADRFALKLHRESHEGTVLALTEVTSGSTGAWLQPHPADMPCSSVLLEDGSADLPLFRVVKNGGFPRSCGGIAENLKPGRPGCLRVGGRNVSLELLADTLPKFMEDRLPVINGTHRKGTFDFILEWASASDVDQQSCGISLQTALQNQLGLRLRRQKSQVGGYIVDHIERPSPN